MILEAVMLQVRPGMSDSYEDAMRRASPLIASIPGYKGHQLQRCMEQEGKFLLLVQWEKLEDHTIGFRESAAYQEWKAILHPYYDPFPVVEHFEEVQLT